MDHENEASSEFEHAVTKLLIDFGQGASLRVSIFRRQVPHAWRCLPPRVMALLYGVQLGFGLITHIPVATFWAVVAWILFNGSVLEGVVVMNVLALGRAFPLAWIGSHLKSSHEPLRLMCRLPDWSPAIRVLNGLALAFACTYFFHVAFSGN